MRKLTQQTKTKIAEIVKQIIHSSIGASVQEIGDKVQQSEDLSAVLHDFLTHGTTSQLPPFRGQWGQ